jgi:hypothetical protein
MRPRTDELKQVLLDAERCGRYEDGLAAIEKSMSEKQVTFEDVYFERACLQLAAGELGGALDTIRTRRKIADEAQASVNPLLAVVLWLNGKRGEAIQEIAGEIRGIESGQRIYADASGGTELGTLLLYFGLTHNDEASRLRALEWLKKTVSQRRALNWPGPLARHVLGQVSLEDALCSVGDLIGWTLSDVLATASKQDGRLEAHEVLFYLGVKARAGGLEKDAHHWFSVLVALPKRIFSDLQYLAVEDIRPK